MMENFNEVYDKELSKISEYCGPLERQIFDSNEVRMFVYEVCRSLIPSNEKDLLTSVLDYIEVEWDEESHDIGESVIYIPKAKDTLGVTFVFRGNEFIGIEDIETSTFIWRGESEERKSK